MGVRYLPHAVNFTFYDICRCPRAERYVALYTYTSDEAGDLTFNEGDVIDVVKTDGDWWTGSIGLRSGIFPGNFVRKYEEQPVAAAAAAPVEEVETSFLFCRSNEHRPLGGLNNRSPATR